MTTQPSSGRVMTLLGAGVTLVALVLAGAVWILPVPSQEGARTPTPPTPQNAAAEAPLALDVITKRPLFDRTRRPLEVAPDPVEVAPAPVAVTLSLHGVIGDADGGLTALLRLSNSDELFSRQAGESLGDFTIERIENRRVIVKDGADRTLTLILGNE